jgi:hypothetical protein
VTSRAACSVASMKGSHKAISRAYHCQLLGLVQLAGSEASGVSRFEERGQPRRWERCVGHENRWPCPMVLLALTQTIVHVSPRRL